MITAEEIRELTITPGSAPHHPAYLSAASGLVCVHSWIYVVADDEHHLGVFRRDGHAPGDLFRLVDGELPSGRKARKKQKPDFEVLLKLPAFGGYSDGALLAVASGSRPNRQTGVIIGLDSTGALQGEPKNVDLSCIFAPLDRNFEALNIEGAVALGSELLLFQRGNKKNSANAIIRFPLAAFLEALGGKAPAPLDPLSTRTYDLGGINGVPLCFTDAAALSHGDIVFSAAAEDTDDAYTDGLSAGSALGLLGADGACRWIRKLSYPFKIEGLDVRRDGEGVQILMVTDADDRGAPAKLLSGTTPYGPDAESPPIRRAQ